MKGQSVGFNYMIVCHKIPELIHQTKNSDPYDVTGLHAATH